MGRKDFDLIDLDNSSRGINYPDLYDDTYGETLKKSLLNSVQRVIWFAVLLAYLETIFHIWVFHGLSVTYFVKLIMCIPTAVVLSALTSYFKPKVNRVLTWVITGIIILIYFVNVMYKAIFQVFFSIALLDPTNAKVYQYYREIIQGIIDNWLILSLTVFVPIVGLIIINGFRVLRYRSASIKCAYIHVAYFLAAFLVAWIVVLLYGKDTNSPYELIKYENTAEYSIEKIGVVATAEIEIRNLISPRTLPEEDLGDVWVYDPNASHGSSTSTTTTTSVSAVTSTSLGDEPAASVSGSTDEEILTEIIKEIDTSPNILNIDFVSLSQTEKNEDIAAIHKYFATVEPSYKNEYTGMFEGFNLIYMTAEGFSMFAVDETHTPTLYKLTHEGFVFTNFYNPRTGGSTSDGEFIVSTSLAPVCGAAKNFKICGQNSMPFAMGNMFNRTYGITSRAFHDNDYSYYGRDISYPSYGFYYKGKGNGLNVTKHWPESDLEMMQASIPDYIDDELFCVYYMTVSGHLNYSFSGNYCAKIHKNEVQDLPYTEGPQAYIACQMEFDLALKYLLEQLEEKGIADRTVICFTGDHWPYGLSNDEISEILGHKVEENFELYKSNLVLWSGAIKEPIVIDEPCCSMDIQPTLMNLFGFDYDSRLFMGRDILSDSEPFVGFMNKSFITDKVMYNASNGKVTYLTDETLPDNYVKSLKTKYNNRSTYSKKIMQYDYYSYICEALGIKIDVPEQNYIPDYSKFTYSGSKK